MAQAAIFATQKSQQAQQAEATKRLETRKFVREILKRYDTNRDGGLKFEELRTFLLDLDPKRKGKGKRITDGEVKWVIQVNK
jgi:Ca2+-binding EF-hand superfamily protein